MKELISIQNELNVPKTQWNEFGKYFYRKTDDIFSAVKPLLAKFECTLTVSDELVSIDGWHYVKAIARVTNSEGRSEECSAFAREELVKKGMDSAQLTGSCSSYARKYALAGLFLLDDDIEPDNASTPEPDKPTSTKKPKSKPSGDVSELLKEALSKIPHCTKAVASSPDEDPGYKDLYEAYPELSDNKEFQEALKAKRSEINGIK